MRFLSVESGILTEPLKCDNVSYQSTLGDSPCRNHIETARFAFPGWYSTWYAHSHFVSCMYTSGIAFKTCPGRKFSHEGVKNSCSNLKAHFYVILYQNRILVHVKVIFPATYWRWSAHRVSATKNRAASLLHASTLNFCT